MRELGSLGLGELRPLERIPGAADRADLGVCRSAAGGALAVVVGRRGGADLIGWAHVAVLLAGDDVQEALIAAPVFGARARRAAARSAAAGLRVRLASIPALADEMPELHELEALPGDAAPSVAAPAATLLDRVLRVIDGAAAITGAGALRRVDDRYYLYMRGVPALRLTREGDAVAAVFSSPERRPLRVTEANFPQLCLELHEEAIALAQDPRLLEAPAAARDASIEAAAAAAGARVTGRWLPWSHEATDVLDWVGIDSEGRPVLGVICPRLELADVPGIVAAREAFEEEREQWAPGAIGEPRVVVSGRDLAPPIAALLARLGLEAERQPLEVLAEPEPAPAPAAMGGDREPRGRRRGRRRRRGRGDEGRYGPEGVSEPEGPFGAAADRDPRQRAEPDLLGAEKSYERADGEDEGETEIEAEEPDSFAAARETAEPDEDRDLDLEREIDDDRPRWRAAESRPERADAAGLEPELEESEPVEPDDEDEEFAEPAPSVERGEAGERGPDRVAMEIEATLAEEPSDGEEPGEDAEREPEQRIRRQRAVIVTHADPDSILAGLVVARDRRTILGFYVCGQDGLMDFFRTRGTDLPDNADLLVVGFTAQPTPIEVIRTAGLYRGRIQWLDHHAWPIEDLERLRDAIGRENIVLAPEAATPLAAVMEVVERRSRFTDKLVDLAGRRLSENDMQRWGYRVAGLIQRMAQNPGEHRNEIQRVLTGKPSELPEPQGVYAGEEAFVRECQPRLVYFGEYPMAVVQVPAALDAAEVGRRLRQKTGARLSLAAREGDDVVVLAANDERRHVNVLGMVDELAGHLRWAHPRTGGDRAGRIEIENLAQHPERLESLIGEIVRHKSVLYG